MCSKGDRCAACGRDCYRSGALLICYEGEFLCETCLGQAERDILNSGMWFQFSAAGFQCHFCGKVIENQFGAGVSVGKIYICAACLNGIKSASSEQGMPSGSLLLGL